MALALLPPPVTPQTPNPHLENVNGAVLRRPSNLELADQVGVFSHQQVHEGVDLGESVGGGSLPAHPLPVLHVEQRALQEQFQDAVFTPKCPESHAFSPRPGYGRRHSQRCWWRVAADGGHEASLSAHRPPAPGGQGAE